MKSSNLLKTTLAIIIPTLLLFPVPVAKAADAITLNASQDAFVSTSTTSGNRRMLFVGTYTDTTVCSPTEGCPPVYESSRALLKFPINLPPNTLPISAELKLSHYGSNADINLTVSRITTDWTEVTVAFPGPAFEGNYGSALISSFNTTNPATIKTESIQLKPELITQLIQNNNGFLIRPTNNTSDPGLVFCSKDSDGFCQVQHAPQLVVQYIQNNAPNIPTLTTPQTEATFSGNCNESIEPQSGICRDTTP